MNSKHLGRGLEALISNITQPQPTQSSQTTPNISTLDISSLTPPKWQPRKKFDEEKLQQLAQSIKSSGIIEPLIVCPLENNKYEIVCGERRYRAAQIAGINSIPVVIKNLDQTQKSFLSLVENIQREDLSPIEEAYAYKKIIAEYNLTQEKLAEIVGKDRSVISNTLRILNLPQQVINLIEDGLISAGHARSLASIDNLTLVEEIAQKIVQDKLTVRDVENIVQHYKTKKSKQKTTKEVIPEIKLLEKELQQSLGTKVKIANSKNNKGKIIIHYHSVDEFDRILKKLK